ncbi:MAG: hypothetical protein PHQ86_08520 [Dehalococcoidales bacterium]|nr:hypothetical protein [Dehalococcoidales bacterium]
MPLIGEISVKHPIVAQKLEKAALQLSHAQSVEELQQIGILLRDAWIELVQKLFKPEFVPDGEELPPSDKVKTMLEYIMAQWKNCPRILLGIAKSLHSLSNEIQHDSQVDAFTVTWGLTMTTNAIALMLDLDLQHEKLADRRYYKCPQCGSLELTCVKDTEVDPIDGPMYDYESWKCSSCDWEHYIIS